MSTSCAKLGLSLYKRDRLGTRNEFMKNFIFPDEERAKEFKEGLLKYLEQFESYHDAEI